ncbi:hypothetical protein FKG96_12580 [Olivibacter sp. LS-1]|uniref:hypothetical protein n=1 Tax=Olivibacter sp. LS-1 TaxID=2592345 RepID=UPI0011EB0D15|nr:hypothetical protein [Olivibacter sp. LS-1]QEL01608.1 hypothetical protein FKG96_12580 [Olivibacter sp. LS-1]
MDALQFAKFHIELLTIWMSHNELIDGIDSKDFFDLFYPFDENEDGSPKLPPIPEHPLMTNEIYFEVSKAFSQNINGSDFSSVEQS